MLPDYMAISVRTISLVQLRVVCFRRSQSSCELAHRLTWFMLEGMSFCDPGP